MTNTLESYYQTYTYDTGNNLTRLSHQANSNTWQQNIDIHLSNNRGTETQLSTTDFDTNGNLLALNDIGTLDWHYNNTLSKLTKGDNTEYYVYDYQGNRVRAVLESNQKIQSQKDYLPSLDISTNEKNQATNTLHIGTHILTETTKDNTQTCYQLSNHLQSNTLELNDKAEIVSYEHFYPYGGTAIITGKDQDQVQQKRYRYTGKERDDNSGLSYYGARYLAPWMARWISPDSAGAVDGLNLYVYVSNNPLKYTDPTGHAPTVSSEHIPTISWEHLTSTLIEYMSTHQLNLWVGEKHSGTAGKKLFLSLHNNISQKRNMVLESVSLKRGERFDWAKDNQKITDGFKDAPRTEVMRLQESICRLTVHRTYYDIGTNSWDSTVLDEQELKKQGLKEGSDFLVGYSHLLNHKLNAKAESFSMNKDSFPAYWNFEPDIGIALVPIEAINQHIELGGAAFRDSMQEDEFGIWAKDEDNSTENAILILGKGPIMKGIFGDMAGKVPVDLSNLTEPNFAPSKQSKNCCTIL